MATTTTTPRPITTTNQHYTTTSHSPCSPNPCLNDGECDVFLFFFYKCTCKEFYSGTRCETPPPCDRGNNPCYNGGTCVNTGTNSYQCECKEPWAATAAATAVMPQGRWKAALTK